MRTKSLLKIASLALVLAAPLAAIANAGDHSGDQWRSDDDGRQVATAYAQPNPALVQLEARTYQDDVARLAGMSATFKPNDLSADSYIKPASPELVQMEERAYRADLARHE